MRSYVEADLPWVVFDKDDRKIDVMRPHLEAAAREGRSRVAAVGVAQEYQHVFAATESEGANGIPWFDYYKTFRRVSCYYFYIWDERIGPAFIKVGAYAPYPVKVWVNGHETVKRSAASCGLPVTALSNGFAATADPAALQDLCDQIQAGTLAVFFERWMSRLPLPLSPADRDRGLWWQLSMRQIEVSRTIVVDDPRRVRAVFEQLLRDNLDLGRPEHIEIIFGRRVTKRTPGTFSTRLLNRGDQVTLNLSFKHSRIKIYLKQDRALRIETVINDPADLGCLRSLTHLDELQAKARACNARLMDAVRAGQGSAVLASPAFERIAQPTLTEDGRRAPALRFGDPRVQALAGALSVLAFAVTGITNKSLRAWMTGLHDSGYGINQASYDLSRLRRNGLIHRVAHTNTYALTADGQLFAIFYSKVHDRVLYPLLAADQPGTVPLEVRQALRTIDRHLDHRIQSAHVARAA